MSTHKFPKTELQAIVNGDHETAKVALDALVAKSRWSLRYRLIFELGGMLFQVYYTRGATELQTEDPFEFDTDEIEVTEVEAFERTITDYRPVSAPTP